MAIECERLPALAAPTDRRWEEGDRLRRQGSLMMAEALVAYCRQGVLPDLSPTTVAEFGMRRGLSATEARQIADMAFAVEKREVLKVEVQTGELSLHSVAQLGRVAKDEALCRALGFEGLCETAKGMPAEELKTVIDRGIEQTKAGDKPVVTLTFHVPDDTRKSFRRAREIASKKAGTALTEGQTLTTVVDHYLDSLDPDRVKPAARRMPDTNGRLGRGVAARVKREVRARTDGRCQFPGCTNKIWVELAHRVPHARGGDREARNLVDLCHQHHRRFDRGELFIEGPSDAPEFYDSNRRRIGANGRVVERAPP